MRKRSIRLNLLFFLALADLLGVLLGLVTAYYLRFGVQIIEVTKGYSPRTYLAFLPIAIGIWWFWLESMGCYRFGERAFNLQILKKILRANLLAVMTVIAIHYFQRSQEYSRLLYPLAVVTCSFSLAFARLVLDRVLARMRRAGKLAASSVVIIGSGAIGTDMALRIRKHGLLGMKVAGFISAPGESLGRAHAGFPVLGSLDDIWTIVGTHHIDEVILAQPNMTPQEILDFMLACEKNLVSSRAVPNVLEAKLVDMSVEQIDGIPLFGLKESPLQGWNIVVKRTFDILVSALLLAVLSPVLIALALLVRLSSRGPVLYRQERVGLDNRRFTIYKFRSMRADAEDASGPVWAREHDPRTTAFGRFLRRHSLDELPQLWNVLQGDMSLVGPRPERPHFVEQFRDMVPRYMGRHRVKCGMTGWAQVNGLRGNTPIEERIVFDLYYIENWSIWLDVKILLMTLVRGGNAY
jgi:exopolysaccharide biosynthesis polyprenyl glycosylphosphotransferase